MEKGWVIEQRLKERDLLLYDNLQINVHTLCTRARDGNDSWSWLVFTRAGRRLDLGTDDQITDVLFRPCCCPASELVVARLNTSFVLKCQLL